MENRGPIMIATSLSMVFSMVAFIQFQKLQADEGPENISTAGAEMASCQSRGIQTAFGRLGCSNNSKISNRRIMPGGAVFLSAKSR